MNQRTHLYRSVSLENSIKQLKYCLALAIREIKYSACGLDDNKALGFASSFISISTVRLMLYFTYSTRGNALTNTYRSEMVEEWWFYKPCKFQAYLLLLTDFVNI